MLCAPHCQGTHVKKDERGLALRVTKPALKVLHMAGKGSQMLPVVLQEGCVGGGRACRQRASTQPCKPIYIRPQAAPSPPTSFLAKRSPFSEALGVSWCLLMSVGASWCPTRSPAITSRLVPQKLLEKGPTQTLTDRPAAPTAWNTALSQLLARMSARTGRGGSRNSRYATYMLSSDKYFSQDSRMRASADSTRGMRRLWWGSCGVHARERVRTLHLSGACWSVRASVCVEVCVCACVCVRVCA